MRAVKRRVQLSVPGDIAYIPLIRDFVGNVARMTGFHKRESEKIELAVEEAASNVILHAFAPGEEGSFDVIAEPTPLGIKIIIKEMGAPFDPSQIPQYDPGSLGKHLSCSGLGVYLMRNLMDEVSFHNLGRGGKETHLFKYLNVAHPVQRADEPETEKAGEEIPRGSLSYAVRRMEPSEAVEVSKCAYASYNYSYINEHIYYPERVKAFNETGKFTSFVPVAPDGELMGHGALKAGAYEGVAECGVIFVKPKFRGQGCMNSIMQALIEEGKRRQLVGLFAQAVTSHPFSQKALHKFGFKDTSLLLSRVDPVEFKDIAEGKRERESLMCSFAYLTPPKGHRIFPPPHHADMIIKIYKELGAEPEPACREKDLPGADASVRVTTDAFLAAEIEVLDYGLNVVPEVYKNLTALCVDRIETVFLHLNLCDPLTARMTKEFEKMGFFFAGINPGPSGTDILVLQYLNNLRFDYDRLRLASEMGRQLADYIKQRDPVTVMKRTEQRK